MNNILLEKSSLPFEAIPFDKIDIDMYLPAFQKAVEVAKTEIDNIVNDSNEPNFDNTIKALENSGKGVIKIQSIFFNLLEALSNEKMQEIAEEVSPLLTELSLYSALNTKLFLRVKKVYDKKEILEPQDKKLLEDTYLSFQRDGANLDESAKEQYSNIVRELNLLSLKFSNNVLAETNKFYLELKEEDLDGLPKYVIETLSQNAKERGLDNYVVTLNMPSYIPTMKYSKREDIRKKLYLAHNSRATNGENSNVDIVKRIVKLRHEAAQILGYKSYADYVLEVNMVKTKDVVNGFLSDLMSKTLPYAKKEVEELLVYARSHGYQHNKIMPWDFAFWSEKYLQEKYSLDEELLKPYFKLENCIDAVFGLANTLYDITFKQRHDIPVYHPDVNVYEVLDKDGQHLSLLYTDFFPRASKRGGAWMTEFRGQYFDGDKDVRPFISIVMNFSKPTDTKPSLLTHDELVTFLHEFGHALHGMLTKCKYLSQSGTNVARDFVELPSQIMENWGYEKDFLQSFAKDYRTNEPIPSAYIDRIVSAKNYLSAYYQVRQLNFGILDMAWHCLENTEYDNVIDFEKKCLAPYLLLEDIQTTAISTAFNHIFAGGYCAGYYSYKWAEVLEADAFALFKEKGIFNKEVAKSFRNNILEKGSTQDEAVLYRNFRGRDPKVEALLKSLSIGE